MDQDDSGKEQPKSPRDKRISELFLTACDMTAEGREAFLDQACAGDAELRAEVESLLAHWSFPAFAPPGLSVKSTYLESCWADVSQL